MKPFPPLTTTVVGSYPAEPPRSALLSGYRTGQDAFLESIKESVEEQTKVGIEIISDGQTRNDMLKLFTTKLHGIRMKSKPVVIGEIEHRAPITVADQAFIRPMLSRGQKLKGIVTGPLTLAMSCVDEHYGSQEEMAFGFAKALNGEIRLLEKVVDVIQVDEPFMSVDFPAYGHLLIDETFAGTTKPRALHICGDVSGIFDQLVEFGVDILDHEFAAHPDLLNVVAGFDTSKMIGYGCVRSDDAGVESVGTISERIKRGKASIGDERMLLDPDCGLRHLGREVARQKLENMVKARDVNKNEG